MLIASNHELGTLVRDRRERLGWTQQELADRADTTRQWISRFEKGASDVTLERALAVLRVLNLDLEVRRPGERAANVEPFATIAAQLRNLKLPVVDPEQSRRIAASSAADPRMKEAIARMSRLTFTVPQIAVRAAEDRPDSALGRESDA